MKTGRNNIIRVVIFSLITLITICSLNIFFQPAWYDDWNNYYTIKGFYKEPKNSLETVILGSSVSLTAITPTELYTEYGMSAYNLATEQQPVLASYYWLEEAYRLHGKTLKNVVFDVSAVREDASEAFYHKAFDSMKLSPVKIKGILNYTKKDTSKYDEMKFSPTKIKGLLSCAKNTVLDAVNFAVPLLSYHNRWSSLNKTDFEKFGLDPVSGTRGYYYLNTTYTDLRGYEAIKDKVPILDTNAKALELDGRSTDYLRKIMEFCRDKNLNLILIRTVAKNWEAGYHNAIQAIADDYGIQLIDFNFHPYYDAYGYVHTHDSYEGVHMNYFGASKFTKWLGKYIVDNYGCTDVRNKPGYEHMEKQVEKYNEIVVEPTKIVSAEKISDYLSLACSGDNTVLISVYADGASALSDDDRSTFAALGLEKLSKLAYRDSYVGVINNGKVLHEAVKAFDPKIHEDDVVPLTYSGRLSNGDLYDLSSSGVFVKETAFVRINGEDQLETNRGLNIVVYSNITKSIVHSTIFDTFMYNKKNVYGLHNTNILLDKEAMQLDYDPESVEGLILAYEKRIDRMEEQTALQNKIGQNNLFGFLLNYWNNSDNVIAISVYDQAAGKLTNTDRKYFLKFGLTKLATLTKNDSYIACINGGKIILEEKSNLEQVYWDEEPNVYIKSGSTTAGKACSIKFNGVESINKGKGINIAVYSKSAGEVIAKAVFATDSKPITY